MVYYNPHISPLNCVEYDPLYALNNYSRFFHCSIEFTKNWDLKKLAVLKSIFDHQEIFVTYSDITPKKAFQIMDFVTRFQLFFGEIWYFDHNQMPLSLQTEAEPAGSNSRISQLAGRISQPWASKSSGILPYWCWSRYHPKNTHILSKMVVGKGSFSFGKPYFRCKLLARHIEFFIIHSYMRWLSSCLPRKKSGEDCSTAAPISAKRFQCREGKSSLVSLCSVATVGLVAVGMCGLVVYWGASL